MHRKENLGKHTQNNHELLKLLLYGYKSDRMSKSPFADLLTKVLYTHLHIKYSKDDEAAAASAAAAAAAAESLRFELLSGFCRDALHMHNEAHAFFLNCLSVCTYLCKQKRSRGSSS